MFRLLRKKEEAAKKSTTAFDVTGLEDKNVAVYENILNSHSKSLDAFNLNFSPLEKLVSGTPAPIYPTDSQNKIAFSLMEKFSFNVLYLFDFNSSSDRYNGDPVSQIDLNKRYQPQIIPLVNLDGYNLTDDDKTNILLWIINSGSKVKKLVYTAQNPTLHSMLLKLLNNTEHFRVRNTSDDVVLDPIYLLNNYPNLTNIEHRGDLGGQRIGKPFLLALKNHNNIKYLNINLKCLSDDVRFDFIKLVFEINSARSELNQLIIYDFRSLLVDLNADKKAELSEYIAEIYKNSPNTPYNYNVLELLPTSKVSPDMALPLSAGQERG